MILKYKIERLFRQIKLVFKAQLKTYSKNVGQHHTVIDKICGNFVLLAKIQLIETEIKINDEQIGKKCIELKKT